MNINEIQDQLIDEFSIFDDWMDKYQYIIDLSKDLVITPDSEKVENNLIKGCQSRVWLSASYEGGFVKFTADSDAIITKGIISLLIKVLSNRSPKEIIDADLYFLEKIGLKEHLSPTRANGLVSMVKQIKMYALAYNSLNK
jgi:cysteine desulfuration protein SufE